MKRTLPILSLLLTAGFAHADVKLPALLSDHMILQREKPVAIWGWADAGEEVTVKFGDQSKKVTTGKDGAWKVSLDALKASSEGRDLSVKGKNEIVLKDILVGEVWLCSGQSNMGFTVNRGKDAEAEMAAANDPLLRLFHVLPTVADEPQKDLLRKNAETAWQLTTPQTVGPFTAAGYFFARELRKELNVPVGLINSSWGGTRAEAWVSKPSLEAVPSCKAIFTGWAEHLKTYNPEEHKKQWDATCAAMKEKIDKIKEANAQPGAVQQAVPDFYFHAWEDDRTVQHRPCVLFNGMIAPVVGYTIKGGLWYQGESNQNRASQYLDLMPALIKDWRKQWNDQFSFYIVQLAGYGVGKAWPQPVGAPDPWAELQWAQLQTALKVPKSGLAVANDIGEEKDIHPKNKQEVGRRLALQALVKDYGKKNLVSGGPIFGGGSATGNKYLLAFSNVGGGLKSRDGGDLKGFIIAGEDQVWKPAKAKIVGKQVQVWSEAVPNPAAVRYAWSAWCPEANLINAEGLPASVFRTDKWDLFTKGAEDPFAPVKLAVPAAVTPVKTPEKGVQPAAEPQLSPQKKAA